MTRTIKTVFQWGTRSEKDAPITWWDTPQTAAKVAAMFHQELITDTIVKTTYDDPSDIDKPEAKFFGPLQINHQGGDNHQRNITPDSLAAFIENWRMTLPNRAGDNTTAEHILNNLENIYIK